MNPHTPKWTLILGVEVPMDFQIFRRQLQGFFTLESSLYHWKELKHRCIKRARMTHLDIWNTSYGQKKGQELNWQFDSQPLKVKNRPNFLVCKWLVKYHWKSLNEGYNFASNLIVIGGLHAKLWAPKVVGVPVVGISGLPFGNPETKCHLDVGLVERHRK